VQRLIDKDLGEEAKDAIFRRWVLLELIPEELLEDRQRRMRDLLFLTLFPEQARGIFA